MKRNQTGFTLIEIAIVLVIIGLLLGGVLKGQEMINSAKVKNLANDLKNTPVLLYGYQDKFKVLPGDDLNAASHVGGTVATTGGTAGNGVIEGTWNTTTTTDESFKFWEHVRLAGLATGGTGLPTNAVGGQLGVTGTSPISTLPGSFIVCSGNIPGKIALQLDTTIDDGNTSTGSLRALLSTTASGTAATVSLSQADTLYTVCSGS
ncbi:hypothetical protein MTYP_03170 [Methylophilaceae bacterium]|nr:hypothetical protein MTYP_03170 [Methylophilaceae bacterium]